jgi:hypothetical protein
MRSFSELVGRYGNGGGRVCDSVFVKHDLFRDDWNIAKAAARLI